MALKEIGDHGSSSQKPSPSSSALATFSGTFHCGILGIAILHPHGLTPILSFRHRLHTLGSAKRARLDRRQLM
jgi:hypothetical protein